MRDREHTIYTLARLGVGVYHVEQVLRALPTIQRAHEAACNWPEPVSGPFVKRGESAMKRVRAILTSYPTIARVAEQGDPRGCAIEVYPKDERDPARLGAPGFTLGQMRRIDAYADSK